MNGTSERLKLSATYPLADRMTYHEAENLFRLYGPRTVLKRGTPGYMGCREQWIGTHIRAAPTGEKRPPKKGEWYLSGSTIAAYRAPNDLATPYHIATIVRIEKVVIETKHDITLDDGPLMGDQLV